MKSNILLYIYLYNRRNLLFHRYQVYQISFKSMDQYCYSLLFLCSFFFSSYILSIDVDLHNKMKQNYQNNIDKIWKLIFLFMINSNIVYRLFIHHYQQLLKKILRHYLHRIHLINSLHYQL